MIIRNLVKSYASEPVLKGISGQVDAGECIAIIGASGSGKSTLLRCLALKEKWDEGEYIIDGRNAAAANLYEKWRIRKRWAFLDEKPDINPKQTALRNVLAGRSAHMPLWRTVTGRAGMDEHINGMDYLEKVGLLDKADNKAANLSGGEQQRVAIAKALVQEAQIIFADDPSKGLDPGSVERVMQDLRSVSSKQGVTVFVCIHQLELAEKYATRIWALADGKIALDIPARRLTMREKDMIL